jgi:VanZ family protein
MMQPGVPEFMTARSTPRSGTMRLLAIWERSRPLFAMLGWLMLLAIVYATLSTIEQRPRIPSLSPDIERFCAYFALSLALGIGHPSRRTSILVAGLFLIPMLETAQLLSATRHGEWHDSLIKLAGLASGLGLVKLLESIVRRCQMAGRIASA